MMRQVHCKRYRVYVKDYLFEHSQKSVDDVCQLPFCVSEGHENWVQCERCQLWCHNECAGLNAQNVDVSADDFVFVCIICTLKT